MSENDIGMDDVMGAIIALDKKVDGLKDTVDANHEVVKGELEAIRQVVDNDLASYEQVLTLEGKMTDVQKAVRQHGKKLDTLMAERAR